MPLYTPTEILAAGQRDTRETFAHLYVALDQLKQDAAYLYHLAYVDIDANNQASGQTGRLPFHPAPAGFGGNEIALLTRPVHLDRLTAAGLALYIHGARTAYAEREQVLEQIRHAEHDLERMHAAVDGTTARVTALVERGIDSAPRRAAAAVKALPQSATTAWDVPVRIPGTTNTLPAIQIQEQK